ncbi:hypothetical protein [Anderseniella sp. Alg231-50]|uniref:hypothetical protein n=1 Tax=Anderseniella sp. Alg231-50 TaxID=1922226 RepID=UPI000D55D34A
MKILSQIATTLFGLLAGGMVLIATGLVPYWRSLDPADFTQVFATSLPTVGGTMIALTILGTGSMFVAAGLALWKKLPNKLWLSAGAAATLIMLICVPIYFGTANPLLAGGTLTPDAITAELATWQQMHWFRTIVGILGLFCAVRAGYVGASSSK